MGMVTGQAEKERIPRNSGILSLALVSSRTRTTPVQFLGSRRSPVIG
jgi:hypothetical protein